MLKILLVDDNPDDRILIIRELKKLFVIDVEEIIDNAGLNRSLKRLDFDIVITDYQLRWTTGIEVLIKIKSLNPLLPVIMFTGTGSEEIAVMAMKVGLDDYILKSPQHYVRLAMTVKSAIIRMQDEMRRKQAENALRKSEENYRSLVENIGIGFARYDQDFNILMVNNAQARMFKRELSEFPGLKHTDLYCQHSMEVLHGQIDLLRSANLPRENLTQGKRSDNSKFDVLIRTFPTYDGNGELSGYIETSEDVSGRLRSERLQEVIFNIANAVLVTDSLTQLMEVICNELTRVINTSDMRILLTSDESDAGFQLLFASGIFRISEEPLKGKTLAGLVTIQGRSMLLKNQEIIELISLGEVNQAFSGLKVWMGVPLKNRNDIFGVLVLQSFDAEDIFNTSDLDILQFVSSQVAIAIENKRNVDYLRESELRFRNLIEQSADGVIIISGDGTILKWNPAMASISLITANEAIGMKIWDLQFEISSIINKDENFRFRLKAGFEKLEEIFKINDSLLDEARIRLPDGESRIVQLTIFPIRYEGESNYGAFVKDITQQCKAIEEIAYARRKAEESDRLKTTFLSNISHELRTPLNAIVGFAALLTEQGQSEEDLRKCSEQIFENSNSLLDKFNYINEIAKIESGSVKVSISEFEVNEFIDELTSEALQGFVKKNVRLRVYKPYPGKKIPVNSDRHYLRQVLIQLLMNVIKFTNEGFVELGYYLKSDDKILFFVCNADPAVPEGQSHLLHTGSDLEGEDFQLEYPGMGIGLNVVKKIVTLLGAELIYKHAIPHESAFIVEHPIAKQTKVKEMEKFSMDNLASITDKWIGKNILIVEDVPRKIPCIF